MTNYIYLLYGTGDECYTEAAYSIGTLRRQLDAASSRIIVFTDQPERVKDWPVDCESIVGQLSAMRGKMNFSHRAKLCAIQKCFEKYAGNVFYLDSDTSVRRAIGKLAEKLSPSTAIMYEFECLNPEIGLAGFQAELAGGMTYKFSAAAQMYNAGVIGLHQDCRQLVARALELCDALLDYGSRVHTVEQFAVSETLRISNIKVLVARGTVLHYPQHKSYMREKIHEAVRQTGRQPWQFERPVAYARWHAYWLKKFGHYFK